MNIRRKPHWEGCKKQNIARALALHSTNGEMSHHGDYLLETVYKNSRQNRTARTTTQKGPIENEKTFFLALMAFGQATSKLFSGFPPNSLSNDKEGS
jgi:hypothetical protein